MATVLAIRNLGKSYPVGFLHRSSKTVLEGVSLELEQGEILGYLGPNGSGKTTTLKILTGIVAADTGSATILGVAHTERGWRQKAGYLPEHPYFYDYLTPAEYLDYVGRLFDMKARARKERSRLLLEQVGLSRSANVPLRRFSKGMLQRLGLAQALINDPELVFLDEPMSGLDPIGRRLARDLILGMKKEGKTVFFSTHILPDAETLCDRVALLRGGKLVGVGALDSILRIGASHVEILTSLLPPTCLSPLGVNPQTLGDRLRLEIEESRVEPVLAAVVAAGGRVFSVQPLRQSLEDYFLKEIEEKTGEWTWDD